MGAVLLTVVIAKSRAASYGVQQTSSTVGVQWRSILCSLTVPICDIDDISTTLLCDARRRSGVMTD